VAAFTGHPDLWYGASKAALLNITKSYAGYLGREGGAGERRGARPDAHRHLRSPAAVAETVFWLGTASPEYLSGAAVDINNGAYPR